MRNVCEAGVELIKQFEGLHRVGDDGLVYPYLDAVGFPTIGWGTLISRDREVSLDRLEPITVTQADNLLSHEIARCAASVLRLINVPLTDEQFGALVSFVYNLGAGSLQSSTLRKRLNAGDYAGAADQFVRWVYAGGVILRGLQRRRNAERALFIGATKP